MEEREKRPSGRKIFFTIIALLLIAGMAAGPFFLSTQQKGSGTAASILSARVERGTIQKTLSGTGTLTEQDPTDVTVPAGVKITEYLVKNGQIVQEGDALAVANRTSVMETISTVHQAMEDVEEEMRSAMREAASIMLTSPAIARVKAVYARYGEDAQAVLLRNGALAVLSLDGLMAVSLPAGASLSLGQPVTVTLSDGKDVDGRTESFSDGQWIIVISDAYGKPGETVQITAQDGTPVGSGLLYVHSPWNVITTGGKISGVYITEGQTVWAESTLIQIDQSSGSGAYEQLASEHRDYEDVMLELFRMYESGVITAPCSGSVSGMDEDTLKLLGNAGEKPVLTLLKNAPGEEEDSETVYRNRIGMVTALDRSDVGTTATVWMQAWDTELADNDYQDTGYLVTAASTMTRKDSLSLPPVYEWNGLDWETVETPEPGDVFLFAYDSDLIWMIRIGHNQIDPADYTDSGRQNDKPGGNPSGGQGIPSGETADYGDFAGQQKSSFSGSSGSGGRSGGTPSGSASQPSRSTASRYETEGTVILSITPQEEITVTITVDELDILSVQEGQDVTVTLDALSGRSFHGTVADVDAIPTNEGGNTKYSAKVLLKRESQMLGGMNASTTIIVESLDNVLLIPSEALAEENGKPVVYTAYDEKEEKLTAPVPVEIGLSDGIKVQILSGAEEGDTVWYSYYDKLEIAGLPEIPLQP